jgi:hypothetical protein
MRKKRLQSHKLPMKDKYLANNTGQDKTQEIAILEKFVF